MIDIDWKPDKRKLRQFGWVCLVGFAVVGLIVAWKTGSFQEDGNWTVPIVLWTLSVVCWILGLLAPEGLRPVYLILTLIAFPIGLVVSNVVLLVIFLFLITPLALWFRIIGRDELNRDRSARLRSYWLQYRAPQGSESYYRQF